MALADGILDLATLAAVVASCGVLAAGALSDLLARRGKTGWRRE